jgi:hypothetical protein
MRIWLVALLLWLVPGAALAGIALPLDAAQLAEALKGGQPCCVIDARSEGPRKQNPIPFAIPYRDGMAITATTFAVVIADNDQRALDVAQRLAVLNKGRIFAVKGGLAAWREAMGEGAGGTMMPKLFIIPSDTCEQGKPLHEFK